MTKPVTKGLVMMDQKQQKGLSSQRMNAHKGHDTHSINCGWAWIDEWEGEQQLRPGAPHLSHHIEFPKIGEVVNYG